MKIIFLDIDGVLNSHEFYQERHAKGGSRESKGAEICPKLVDNFNRVLVSTGAKVVLSSTWRKFVELPKMVEILKSRGCILLACDMIGATPVLDSRTEGGVWKAAPRGLEIDAWLNTNPAVDRFVIIDDDGDMAHLLPHLVRTSFVSGLTAKKADEAIAMLNSNS